MNQSPEPSNRQIRVFISSTFRDMQAERDHLVKFIFPQLRKLCESRGATWGEVDLRWGVTDEQAAEGKVLPICLEEIKRCRPYFIGLLGERYGWIPDAIPAEVIEREPWLKEHLHGKKSVTELEIIHGVLREEQMHGHAFFYFRDPAFIESIPSVHRQNLVPEDTESGQKLQRLKEEIRHAQAEKICQLRENYPDPKTLGELVLADLTKVINDKWPEGSQPDPLDREAMDHETYAQSRERVYIGRQEYFDRLDTHAAANDTQPLVILGESGSGKSALLANWIARYRQAHPDALVLQHYIGATPYSADWAAMLRRLMGEFKRQLGVQQDIPDQADALRSAFPNWLYMAAAKGRIVIVLDALNQLEDRDGAPDLVWLPPVLPENVRLIVSTLPGRPLDEIQKRNWRTLEVEPLGERERIKLLWRFLRQSGKRLSKERRRRIATAPPSANPLYLRVLLDELRLVRTHEELEERIGDYLQAESPFALYEKVIARWEQDYEGDSDLVGDTLSLLWAARRGLTETELLQALGKDGEPLPHAKWSPLFLAMSDALISRGGLLTFAHAFLRTAIRKRFLPTLLGQKAQHRRLARFYCAMPGFAKRRLDELPWQWSRAKDWKRLLATLADTAFITEAWQNNRFDVLSYWATIEANSKFRMVEAYRGILENPDAHELKIASQISVLLEQAGHTAEALWLCEHLVDHFSSRRARKELAAALARKALLLYRLGDSDGSTVILKSAEYSFGADEDLFGVQYCLGNEAEILVARGDRERALRFSEKQELFCRELGNKDGLKCSLGLQARIQSENENHSKAIKLLEERERLCRETGDLHGLAECFSCRGRVLMGQRDYREAMNLFGQDAAISKRLGDKFGVQRTLGDQATALLVLGERAEAVRLCREQERICLEIGYEDGVRRATVLRRHAVRNGLGITLRKTIGPTRIRPLHQIKELGGFTPLHMLELCGTSSLDGWFAELATVVRRQGNLTVAFALRKEQERLCMEHGKKRSLLLCLCEETTILSELNRPHAELIVLKKLERACLEMGQTVMLAACFGQQAMILETWENHDEALGLYKRQEFICRELSDIRGLTISLLSQARLLLDRRGETRSALHLVEEAFLLAKQHSLTDLARQAKSIIERATSGKRSA